MFQGGKEFKELELIVELLDDKISFFRHKVTPCVQAFNVFCCSFAVVTFLLGIGVALGVLRALAIYLR